MAVADPTFTILALGPFCPAGEAGFSTRMVPAETETLEDAMTTLNPRIWIPAPTSICPDGGLTLTPGRMEDLLPDGLVRTTPYLKDLHDAGSWIENAATGGLPPETIAAQVRGNWPNLPLDLALPEDGRRFPTHSAVDDLLAMVTLPGEEDGANAGIGGPSSWKIQIDGLLTANLSSIFENEDFRIFEAAWRGAEVVLRRGIARTGKGTALLLVSVSPHGLPDALDALAEQLAAILPNLIIIDMPFDQSPQSLDMLNRVAQFAESLLAPAVVWITPAFLHLHGWDELHRLPLLKNHTEGAVYAKWRKLMARPDGSWLTATCNRFLTRFPYGKRHPSSLVSFVEEKGALWINPVWALAALAAQSTDTFGWPSRFTDDRNIRLRGLAVHELPDGELTATETLIPAERMRQLIEIGITPLAGAVGKDTACIPQETTVAGESLPFQIFFSRMIGFLFRRRDAYNAETNGPDPEDYLVQALSGFFINAGCDPPSDLSVKFGVSGTGRTIPLEVAFTIPISILPDVRRVAFTFSW